MPRVGLGHESFAQSIIYRYVVQMKRKPRLSARSYVSGLLGQGRHIFGTRDAQAALGVSAAAVKLAVHRLAKQGVVASPARGFYVIVPPEYRSLGCLPADQFIPALMQKLGQSYYMGLLSAAQYHGAAHHRPQEAQVMVARPRRAVGAGKVRAVFIVRKKIASVCVQQFNTPRGFVLVSTPEATAVDLVGYAHRAGGLGHVATILCELADSLDPKRLAVAAQTAPLPWAQRLGYLLEMGGAGKRLGPLREYVSARATRLVFLNPSAGRDHFVQNAAWRLAVNVRVEPEA